MCRRWFVWIVMLASLSVSAPAQENDIKIALEEKRVESLSPEGLDLVFYIRLENVSSRDYSLTANSYRFVIQEQEYLRLPARSLGRDLPLNRGSSERIRLPVRITYDNLYRSIAGVQDAVSVNCYIMGEMVFARGRRRGGSLPFAFSAEFPIFRAPTVSVQSVKTRALTIGGADLEVVLKIANPNGFSLDMDDLEYDLKLGGHPLKQGRIRSRDPIASSSEHILSIPLLFNFYDVGKDVHALLLQESVSCQVTGTLFMRTQWERLSLPFELNQRVAVER
ncbi:LEA type 2 family protein [Acidobacteriota bacterium]